MPRGTIKTVVKVDRDNNILEEYKNLQVAAIKTGLPKPTIYSQCARKIKGIRDYHFMYKNDWLLLEEQRDKPIAKAKKKEYYVNVLVGLANQTLVDGAIYEINGSKMKYVKENNALMVGDKKIYSYENMWNVVSIELPLLQPEEKAFLQNLLKAFSNAKGIIKCKDRRQGYEFIRVETTNEEDTITLPSFVEGKYYKSLQRDTLYSLKDLELG